MGVRWWTTTAVLAALCAVGTFVWAGRQGRPPVETPPATLPRLPPPTTDHRVAAFVDRRLRSGDRLRTRVDGTLFTVTDPQDLAAVARVLQDPDDEDSVRNEAANLLRQSAYPQLAQCLSRVCASDRERPRFRSYAAQHLGVLLREARTAGNAEALARLRALLHPLLDHVEHETRREALLALARVDDETALGRARELLDAASAGPLTHVALRIAEEHGWQDQLPALRRHAFSTDLTIRAAAIAALGGLGDQASRAIMDEATRSSDAHLREAGQVALRRLDTGLRPAKGTP